MQWNKNAQVKRCILPINPEGIFEAPSEGKIRKVNGKARVFETHTVDMVEDNEVVASITFKKGQYLLPVAYYHPSKKIFGQTVDAKYTPERGWIIYLDAILRDKDGEPIMIDGQEVDMSGWYPESTLKDAGMGMEAFTLGSLTPSIRTMQVNDANRMRKVTH